MSGTRTTEEAHEARTQEEKGMTDKTKGISRRRFVAGAAGGATLAATGGFPAIVRAQSTVKIGLVHPVTGFLQYSGGQCRPLQYRGQLQLARGTPLQRFEHGDLR